MSIHKRVIVIWVSIMAFAYLMPDIIRVFEIYRSQKNPRQNVSVVLGNDSTYKGSLSRDWNGDYLLKTDSDTIRFNDFKMMKIPVQPKEE
ncbi:hypothetical protein JE959_000111 [Aeromonas veronii]|nr:hypothetical protein [Aeromonas veronii]